MTYTYVIPEKNHLPPEAKAKIEAAINPILADLDARFDSMTAADLAAVLVNATTIATDKHTMAGFKGWYLYRTAKASK